MGQLLEFTPRPIHTGEASTVQKSGTVVLFEAPMSAPSINPTPWVNAAERLAEQHPDRAQWFNDFSQAIQATATGLDQTEV